MKIDWPGLMRVGLQGLGLTPAEFWRLTPLELRIMLGAEPMASALTRTRLEELAAAFPDASPPPEGERNDDGHRIERPDLGAGSDAGGHDLDGAGL